MTTEELDRMTTEELDRIRSKVSGLHFAKETLTANELDIFYLAEDLLTELDRLQEFFSAVGWSLLP